MTAAHFDSIPTVLTSRPVGRFLNEFMTCLIKLVIRFHSL